MSIPFVDLDAQYKQIKEEVLKVTEEVFESKKFIMGDYEKEFSKNFAKVHGSNFSVGCSNGTSAITVALRALGLKAGDEVITVANSFFATVEAIVEVGATPVLVDCEDETYSISVSGIKKALTEKTKAIIPVHLYGNPSDMDEIAKIANENKLAIIEDCAQAHLASLNGRAVGTFGEYGTFSFYPGKNLGAYGDAGAVISSEEKWHKLAGMHIDHGRTKKYEHDLCAGNYRMDGVQAAILNVKAKYIDEWTNQRIKAAGIYNEILNAAGFKTLKVREGGKCVYHLFPVEVKNRDEVMSALKENAISCGIHYPIPLHAQPALKYLGYKSGDFPISERASKQMVSLPMFPEISAEQIQKVCDVFLKVAKA